MISKILGSIIFTTRCHNTYQKNAPETGGLAPSQYAIISRVCRFPGMSQDTLARETGLDKTSVAHRINELEKLGYVTREVSEKDARCRLIRPTQKALAAYPAIHARYEAFTDAILSGLSEEEIEVLTRLTGKVRENARAFLEENADRRMK